jgi:hypothetical protein
VAAEGETAATAAVVVVGEWADAVEDGAVVVRRHERGVTAFFHENDSIKTIPGLRQDGFIWEQRGANSFCAFFNMLRWRAVCC